MTPETVLPDTLKQAPEKPSPAVYYAKRKGYDPELVQKVWNAAEANGMSPSMVVAMVAHESRFNPAARNVNNDRSVDFGLFQLNSRYHPSFEKDLDAHIQYGVKFLADNIRRYGTKMGLGIYNAGSGQAPETKAKRAQYLGRVMGEYQDVTRTMSGYLGWEPNFSMTPWSPQEMKQMVGGK